MKICDRQQPAGSVLGYLAQSCFLWNHHYWYEENRALKTQTRRCEAWWQNKEPNHVAWTNDSREQVKWWRLTCTTKLKRDHLNWTLSYVSWEENEDGRVNWRVKCYGKRDWCQANVSKFHQLYVEDNPIFNASVVICVGLHVNLMWTTFYSKSAHSLPFYYGCQQSALSFESSHSPMVTSITEILYHKTEAIYLNYKKLLKNVICMWLNTLDSNVANLLTHAQ